MIPTTALHGHSATKSFLRVYVCNISLLSTALTSENLKITRHLTINIKKRKTCN